jgi:hypothetical protein
VLQAKYRVLAFIQGVRFSFSAVFATLPHVPAKWIRFAGKDMRQHKNLRRFPVISDHRVIRYDRKALQRRVLAFIQHCELPFAY